METTIERIDVLSEEVKKNLDEEATYMFYDLTEVPIGPKKVPKTNSYIYEGTSQLFVTRIYLLIFSCKKGFSSSAILKPYLVIPGTKWQVRFIVNFYGNLSRYHYFHRVLSF